ncbi:MAG: alpha/beta hydrolase [Solobacterium sp.]|nr:alpha/beta hydrolase [Solobacterium sp.]
MSKTIYKTEEGKQKILELYDHQLEQLSVPYRDLYVETSFGKTHLIETGSPEGEPLLVFHGGNATTAYNLLTCDFLFDDFHIYAVDTIGHPGKSAETSLSALNYDYGKWVGEVIDALGFEEISLFGGSFGGGIIAKTMCAVPDNVKRAVLLIPSGIKNAFQLKNARMMFPMIMYWITGKDSWLKKTMIPMAVTEDNITDDIYETAKLSIDYVKIKTAMPTNVSASKMALCNAPALVMAAEKDCLFPGPGVLKRAEEIIPNCRTYLIKGRGHMHFLTDEEKKMIVRFLLGKE